MAVLNTMESSTAFFQDDNPFHKRNIPSAAASELYCVVYFFSPKFTSYNIQLANPMWARYTKLVGSAQEACLGSGLWELLLLSGKKRYRNFESKATTVKLRAPRSRCFLCEEEESRMAATWSGERWWQIQSVNRESSTAPLA